MIENGKLNGQLKRLGKKIVLHKILLQMSMNVIPKSVQIHF
jgi:hypothetical protein